ncbi:MAG: hypothetical protein IT167_24270 [Bryobacterales bacterium]|nr:hypothetical protein [Bryobacterales bacterium]
MVSLKLFHDNPDSSAAYAEFEKQHVLERVKALDAKARRKGLAELDPGRNPLIALGMEVNGEGKVTKNSYGVFHLSWMAGQHEEWPAEVERQVG